MEAVRLQHDTRVPLHCPRRYRLQLFDLAYLGPFHVFLDQLSRSRAFAFNPMPSPSHNFFPKNEQHTSERTALFGETDEQLAQARRSQQGNGSGQFWAENSSIHAQRRLCIRRGGGRQRVSLIMYAHFESYEMLMDCVKGEEMRCEPVGYGLAEQNKWMNNFCQHPRFAVH